MTKAVKEQSLREWMNSQLRNQPPIYQCSNYEHYSHQTTGAVCVECMVESFIAEYNRRLEKSALTDEQIDVLPLNLVSEYDLPSDSDEEQLREYQIVASAQLTASLEAVNGK